MWCESLLHSCRHAMKDSTIICLTSRGCLCLILLLISSTVISAAPASSEEAAQQEVILEPSTSSSEQQEIILEPEGEEPNTLTSSELRELFTRAAERLVSGQVCVWTTSPQTLKVALEQRLQYEAARLPQAPREQNPALTRLVNGVAKRLTDPRLLKKREDPTQRLWLPKPVHHHYYPPPIHHHAPVIEGHHGSHSFYSELDEDARSRAKVLDAMWRALKSAAGGALAIGGTLARNSGAILKAKGRLMSSTGPLVVALGKQVAQEALHPSHYRELGPSHEELHAAADAAIAQRQHAKFVLQDLYEPFYESTTQLGSALRVAASGTARALGDLFSELFSSARRAYLFKE